MNRTDFGFILKIITHFSNGNWLTRPLRFVAGRPFRIRGYHGDTIIPNLRQSYRNYPKKIDYCNQSNVFFFAWIRWSAHIQHLVSLRRHYVPHSSYHIGYSALTISVWAWWSHVGVKWIGHQDRLCDLGMWDFFFVWLKWLHSVYKGPCIIMNRMSD